MKTEIYFVLSLGERSLFCLNENGSVRFMKKFEYNPSCFIPYNSGKKILLNFLLKIVLAKTKPSIIPATKYFSHKHLTIFH